MNEDEQKFDNDCEPSRNLEQDENVDFLARVDLELEAIGVMLNADPPAEVLAAARSRMDKELSQKRRWRMGRRLRLFGGVVAAAIIALVLVNSLLQPVSVSSSTGNTEIVVYDASANTAGSSSDELLVSDEDMAQVWLDIAESTVSLSSGVEVWSDGLGIYADDKGIFAMSL